MMAFYYITNIILKTEKKKNQTNSIKNALYVNVITKSQPLYSPYQNNPSLNLDIKY